MGLIRGAGTTIICILLFLAILSSALFLTLGKSLEYNELKPKTIEIVKETINYSNLIQNFNETPIQDYCQNHTEYVFKDEKINEVFVIPCDVGILGPEASIEYEIGTKFEEYYYKDYQCEFFDCFKTEKNPLFLISEKSMNYWNEKFYLALIVSIILMGLLFLLIYKKINILFLVGTMLILSSLFLHFLDGIGKNIIKGILSLIGVFSSILDEYLSKVLMLFFAKADSVALVIFIIGLILIIFWIFLEIFKIGFKINDFIEKIKKPAITQKKDKSKKLKEKTLEKKDKKIEKPQDKFSKIFLN